MSPQKIILHHLDSPIAWERDQAERAHSRRRNWSVITAIASVSITTAMLYRGETVEDYSVHSASGPSVTTQQAAASSLQADADSLLADAGSK